MEKRKRKISVGRPNGTSGHTIEMNLKKNKAEGTEFSRLLIGERGNELLGTIKGEAFLYQVGDCEITKKVSAPCSRLICSMLSAACFKGRGHILALIFRCSVVG
jgi:hypothetical protein